MSRWAEAFAALSRTADTLDTIRPSAAPLRTVSQSVKSVSRGGASPELSLSPGSVIEPSSAKARERRAAFVEHDGAVPSDWAEGLARIDPNRPRGDVPLNRWQCFVDDVGLFLDGPLCAVAPALGWGPVDLFGCNRDRPFARIDQAGLLWLLNGNRLLMLAEDAATIETRDGARHTYRRTDDEPGRVLAWELSELASPKSVTE